MAMKGKRQKIDWDNIKVTIVPDDKDNPNPLNPCLRMTVRQRQEAIINISAEIWERHVREKLSMNHM